MGHLHLSRSSQKKVLDRAAVGSSPAAGGARAQGKPPLVTSQRDGRLRISTENRA